MITHYQ